MIKPLAIVFSALLAAICALPLMAAVRAAVIPSGAQLLVLSPNESNEVTLVFALGVAAGAGLAAAVVCYGWPLSPLARWTVVLVPLLVVAVADAARKALLMRYAVDWATQNGIQPRFPLKAVGLHTIPWTGVAAGLLVAGIALWRLRSGRLLGTPLSGSLVVSDDDLPRLSGGDSLVRGTIDPLRMPAYSSAAVSEVSSRSPQESAMTDQTEDVAQANKARQQAFIQILQNDALLDRVGEFVRADVVDHSAPPGLPGGPEGVQAILGAIRAAFPDHDAQVVHMVAEGDLVATYKTMTGTHEGPLFGIPATGRRATIRVMDFVRYKDGQIAEHWNIIDMAGLMAQLGLS